MLFDLIRQEIHRFICQQWDHAYEREWRIEHDDRGAFSHRQLYRVCSRCPWEAPYPPYVPGHIC